MPKFALAAAAAVVLVVLGFVAFAGGPKKAHGSQAVSEARPKENPGATATRARFDPRAPQQRLNARDSETARNAVVHPENLDPRRWRQVASVPEGPHKKCPGVDPNLSRFTLTGKASSSFRAGNAARIDSRVHLYANAGQASLVFQATATPKALRCIGTGLLRAYRANGLNARIAAARVYPRVNLASQGAAYQVVFALRASNGKTDVLPLDVFLFQAGRATGALSFRAVIAKRDEVGLTRLVAGRLLNS